MRVIKRYPNRKLYDTEAKQYITLDQSVTQIRNGAEVQVVDHATGDDLTAVTLTQIIFDQEKKRKGFLPQSVPMGLVDDLAAPLSTLQQTLASPLGLARHVDDEIDERLQALTRRGELAVEEARKLRDQLRAPSPEQPDPDLPTDDEIEQLLEDRGVPTGVEMKQVLGQLETLAAKLDALVDEPNTSE